MSTTGGGTFFNVPQDFQAILDEKGRVDFQKVSDFLDFDKKEIAQAAKIPRSKVKFGARMPGELKKRMLEWARLLSLVAYVFQGDAAKTGTWFSTATEFLGGFAPRDYIQFGRADKLEQIIVHAIEEDRPLRTT